MSALLALPIFVIVILSVVALVAHFIPTFIAWNRHSENLLWIFLINFFLGWTLIGWIVALVWAIQDRPRLAR